MFVTTITRQRISQKVKHKDSHKDRVDVYDEIPTIHKIVLFNSLAGICFNIVLEIDKRAKVTLQYRNFIDFYDRYNIIWEINTTIIKLKC